MFVLEVCFKSNIDLYYLDNGCSRHLTSDAIVLTDLEETNQGKVNVGDKKNDSIIRVIKVSRYSSY